MKAVQVSKPDERLGTISVVEAPMPVAAANGVVVKVAYAGCNFADTMIRRGTYPHPRIYPLLAGSEIAGTVVSVGADVSGIAVGDRVASLAENGGGFAEYCPIPAVRVIPLPDSIGFETAAAFPVQALTAWHMLQTVATTRPGELVLIHAIGGGVGLYLTQLAAQAGATVIGTIGTKGKEKRALEYGASLVINREEEDFVAAVTRFTGGRGLDKIVDSTGGSILDRSFPLMRNLGHVVSYGEAEGKPYANLWERLVRGSLTFTRFHLGHAEFGTPVWKQGVEAVVGGIAGGRIKVPVEGVFGLEEASAMYDRLESRQVAGKLLLKVA